MFETVKFKADHLLPLLNEQLNKDLQYWFTSGMVYDLEKTESVSFINKGEVMVCGGITDYWKGRGQVWSIFSERSKKCFVPTYRAIQKWLKYEIETNYKRIELSVDLGFEIGKRRAEMLGFQLECPLARKYLPGGEDCSLYAMVRKDV